MGFDTTLRLIEDYRDDCVSFLSRICSIPALGPTNEGRGEMEKYNVIKEFAQTLGPDEIVEIHAPDDRVPEGVRPNMAAIFKAADATKTLWILTHIDVVPVGEPSLWDHDPFDPIEKDGFLWGRGVEDNGQALVASLFAVKAVKETMGLGKNVGLCMVSDEECGSEYGLDYVLETRGDLFKPDDLILVPDSGNKDGDHIEVAEKSMLQVRFKVSGKQVHASRPDMGLNSMRAAANMIVELDITLASMYDERDNFYNPPRSTFEPTKKERNVANINTIPGEDVFYFDCRILPDVSLDSVVNTMMQVAGRVDDQFESKTHVDTVNRFDAPQPTPADSPVALELAQAIQEIYGVQAKPHGIGGQTVAAFFRKRGLKAAVWEKIIQTAHEPNERILIDNLLGNTKVFARLMV